MNVATCAAIKGGLSALDLKQVKCQVMLSNTYHLHLRPVTKTSKPSEDFTNSPDGTAPFSPTAADFRFSLAKLRHITEEGGGIQLSHRRT